MDHLLEFNFFGKKNDWESKFKKIYDFYLKNKKSKEIPVLQNIHLSIRDGDISISQGGLDNHLAFYKNENNYEVVDFSEADYSNPKDNKGRYKIDKSKYDEYLRKCQEINDWLDSMDEENFDKSHSTISDTGEINLDISEADIAIDELNSNLSQFYNQFIGKNFEFEFHYRLWTGPSSNVKKIERYEIPVNDITINFGGDRFYAQIKTKGALDEDTIIWLESNSNHEYYDFESHKIPDFNKILKMNIVEKEMSRKQKREYDENRKFPYAISYDVTPSKYNSIEFVKSITDLLSELNSQIRKD